MEILYTYLWFNMPGILKLNIKNIIHPSEGYRDFPEQTKKIIFILMTYKISATGLLFLTLFSLNKLKMDSHIIIY